MASEPPRLGCAFGRPSNPYNNVIVACEREAVYFAPFNRQHFKPVCEQHSTGLEDLIPVERFMALFLELETDDEP